jgi:GTPase-associated system helical domain
MHDRFADWYRLTTPGIDAAQPPDLLERRWKGVEAACVELAPGEEFGLVRLFLHPAQATAPYMAKFRAAFKKADPGFFSQGNELEVAVLAGVAILHRMDRSPRAAGDRGGLAVLCDNGVRATRSPQWAAPLIAEVERKYAERCVALRSPATVTPGTLNTNSLKADFDTFAKSFLANDWPRVQAAGTEAFTTLVEALSTYMDATAAALRALDFEQQLRQEETAILWWMTGEYSRDLDRRLSEIKLPVAALVAGKELADLVTLPGPLPAKSFLDRILSSCGPKGAHHKPAELKAIVNAVPGEWRKVIATAAGFDRVKDFCPILGAVAQSLATDGSDDWPPLYRKAYQRDASLQLSGLELALQAYREWLLVSSAAAIERGE